MFNCAGKPELHTIADPARLGWKPVMTVEHYQIAAGELLQPPGAERVDRRGEGRDARLLPVIGKDTRFWKLADNLVKLYPPGTDERRWVEGVLARKKGLGL